MLYKNFLVSEQLSVSKEELYTMTLGLLTDEVCNSEILIDLLLFLNEKK
jgi:hypothetical protein